ncbi:WD40-repeat-containing domain protein [Thamnocephalis sphaerospora]|uniref:WD40-repeat-containing domain protein n=1 Tax=Thamnocephalis sphaerospora TaxID=78915 RepID=A0A4P9XJC3_9FUNG|nr:WD40-repeat-containing domain protein [Thamnocephalis sphaerospora]|eukprot:RKP05845.1 WD40-repeat-containing domain protein [Thamnocephalis sphaerospora]
MDNEQSNDSRVPLRVLSDSGNRRADNTAESGPSALKRLHDEQKTSTGRRFALVRRRARNAGQAVEVDKDDGLHAPARLTTHVANVRRVRMDRKLMLRELVPLSSSGFRQYTAGAMRAYARDLVSGKADTYMLRTEDGRSAMPMCTMYCPTSSGSKRLLAVGDEEGGVSLLDTQYGADSAKSKISHWQAHDNSTFHLQWAPDGTHLVTASGDQSARWWDVRTQQLLNVFDGHTATIKCIAFHSSDPNILATSSRDGSVMIWDVRCNSAVMDDGYRHHRPANRISNANVHPLGTPALRKRRKVVNDARRSVTSVLFMKHREHLLASAGASDGIIKYWDIRQHGSYSSRDAPTPVATSEYGGAGKRPHGIAALTLDESGTRVFAASTDNHIYQYDARFLGTANAAYTAPTYRCSNFYVGIAISPDDRFLLSGSCDRSAYIWGLDATPSAEGPLILQAHSGEVSHVAWCPTDVSQLATCSDDGTLRVWNVDRAVAEKCRRSENVRQHYGVVVTK